MASAEPPHAVREAARGAVHGVYAAATARRPQPPAMRSAKTPDEAARGANSTGVGPTWSNFGLSPRICKAFFPELERRPTPRQTHP